MKSVYFLCVVLLLQQNCIAQVIDAAPTGVMISHGHPKGGWMFSYTYMNMYMKDNLSSTKKVGDNFIFNNYIMSPVDMKMDMHMLMGMYGITGRLSAMVMTDYRSLSMRMHMLPGAVHNHGGGESPSTEHEMKTSGISDVKLYALYKLLTAEHASLTASLGVNIPSGDITIDGGDDVMYQGQHLPYMMQLGSGSYDILPGITMLNKFNRISCSVQLLTTLRPFDNALKYHYGNEYILNAWGAFQLHRLISVSLRAEGTMADAISGQDVRIFSIMEPGADPRNYGGTRINGFGGINIYITKGVLKESKLGFEYGLPLYQDLNGPQLGLKTTLSAGFTKSF